MDKLKCGDSTLYVFDKGYNNYKAFKHFSLYKTGFLNRINNNAFYRVIEKSNIGESIHSGVLPDEIIEIEVKENKLVSKLKVIKVKFYYRDNKREFEFITNLFDKMADMIATRHNIRWQIELFLKQLKQNFPLKSVMDENENAIKI